MPWITAVGLRCLIPGPMRPAGTIQARLAVRPQPDPFGICGSTPAKIMPGGLNPHDSSWGLSTSHDPGTDSCAFPNGTAAQPGPGADAAAGIARVNADALPTDTSMATAAAA